MQRGNMQLEGIKNKWLNYLINNKIISVLIIGMSARILFILFFAKAYFGTQNIYYNFDSNVWALAFQNLFYTGTYSVAPEHPLGYFGRMPGYSFYLGFFYIITGKDWLTTYFYAGWFQVLIDICNIYLIYRITFKISNSKKAGLATALLYALYPFVIVWNPVCYSEILGIFFLLLGSFFFINTHFRLNVLWAFSALSIGALCRPQLLIAFPFFGLSIIWIYYRNIKALSIFSLQAILGFTLFYMPWPLRNYINHGKFVFTQDIRGVINWDKDVMSFTYFIFSVQTEWEPQFSQIIKNKTVDFPKGIVFSPEDSLQLKNAFRMSQTCGRGFSHWQGYWKERQYVEGCNDSISNIFMSLREKQIKENPINFWIKIPLQNLKKSFFKTKLTDTKSRARKLASYLFYYRSFLLLLGIFSCFYLWKGFENKWFLMNIGGFFIVLYVSLCAGTAALMRNIEMRYFLQADVLLLIPTGIFITKLFSKKEPITN